jgi:sensor histidine kinase YesM
MNWIFKKYSPLILALLISPVFAIFFSGGHATKSISHFLIAMVWSMTIWLTQWYGNEWVYKTVDAKISWLKQPVKKIVVLFFSVAAFSSFAIIVVNLTLTYIVFGGIPDNLATWAVYNGRIAIIIALSVSTIITAMLFFSHWREAAVNEEKLKNELLDYQYKSLVNQVNPHFLFNSLNVLTSLVHDDPDLATKFIQQLSKVYRYTLENRDRDLVSFEDEKKFIESYLFLLNIRFEDSLIVDLQLDENKKGMLIPMALQILVENAIKHNMISKQKPLKLKIETCDGVVCVSNNLQLPKDKPQSTGFGLENIKKRLRLLSDKGLEVEQTETTFTAKLPILTVE